jgi:carboxymethylenebutenolidase
MMFPVPPVAELPDAAFRIEAFAGVGRRRGHVILLPELWGIVPQIRATAARLAAEGFDVFVPDLLPGTLEPTADRELIMARYATADDAAAMRKVAYVADRIRGAGPVGPIVAVGFCYGGRMALHAAAHVKLDAAVSFYGTFGLPSAKPLDPRRSALDTEIPVQAHYGADDASIPPADVEFAGQALRRGRVFVYAGAGHAFMNETRESYRPAAAREAWGRVFEFLRDRELEWWRSQARLSETVWDGFEEE